MKFQGVAVQTYRISFGFGPATADVNKRVLCSLSGLNTCVSSILNAAGTEKRKIYSTRINASDDCDNQNHTEVFTIRTGRGV